MSPEIIIASAAVLGVIITSTGLWATWRKNGKQQNARDVKHAKERAARDTELVNNQNAILRRLDDDRTGLGAINEKVNSMTTHCAEVSTGFGQRILTAERDIKELKQKKS